MSEVDVVVEIDRLDDRAVGRGRTGSGAPASVRGALPGERVEVAVEHIGRDGTRYGATRRVLVESEDRTDPGCRHFLRCGGCTLLHQDYAAQLRFARARVANALGRSLEAVAPTVPSPRTFGYRAFAKLVVGPDGTLGSYRPRTHDVQDMQGCRVHAPEVERIVEAAREALAGGAAEVRYLLVRASLDEGRAVVTVVVRAPGARGLDALVETLAERPDVARVVEHVNARNGDALWDPEGRTVTRFDAGPVVARLGPVRQTLEAGAFSQVNPLAAAALYSEVVAAADAAGRRVLDLYSGSGGVGLALLAAGAAQVHAVESVASAVAAAESAARASGVEGRLRTTTSEVEAALARMSSGEADVVILNPPRKGVGPAVMSRVFTLRPDRIVYVSCNPDSLARDLEGLPVGWCVDDVIPVDMFPHTHHVETIAVLARGPGAVAPPG